MRKNQGVAILLPVARGYREIHRELDISLAAVEYHMTKALAHPRENLEQLE